MTEKVIAAEPDLTWSASVQNAVLLSNDFARSALALEPHSSDADRRCVVLLWEGVRFASMGNPNEEAIRGHRLYDKGLSEIRWLGVVDDSELVASLERQNSVLPFHQPEWFANMRHYVLPLKETTVEVVAATLSIVRVAGSTAYAAATATTPETEPVEPTVV